jgi:hypothetical protein
MEKAPFNKSSMLQALPEDHSEAPHDNIRPILTFEFLDDVLALPSDASEALIGSADVVRIGPLVEYAYQQGNGLERLESKRHSSSVKSLTEVLSPSNVPRVNASSSFEASTFVEFSLVPQAAEEMDDPKWIAFCQRLLNAGIKAGLSKTFSQGLVGTLEEMTSNIFEHSENVSSGLAGYRWVLGEFEYVVADQGIGVLTSLRKHLDYEWLHDAGEALEVAVCDGESRFGRNAHRGTGFHHLLYNIASRDSYVRFRSGDHCYTIDGTVQPILKRTYPGTPFDGFLISLVAKTPKQKA